MMSPMASIARETGASLAGAKYALRRSPLAGRDYEEQRSDIHPSSNRSNANFRKQLLALLFSAKPARANNGTLR